MHCPIHLTKSLLPYPLPHRTHRTSQQSPHHNIVLSNSRYRFCHVVSACRNYCSTVPRVAGVSVSQRPSSVSSRHGFYTTCCDFLGILLYFRGINVFARGSMRWAGQYETALESDWAVHSVIWLQWVSRRDTIHTIVVDRGSNTLYSSYTMQRYRSHTPCLTSIHIRKPKQSTTALLTLFSSTPLSYPHHPI